MTQLSEEQQERVEQIRERQEHNKSAASDNPIPKFLATAYTDIDFLLSLLDSDSQAAGSADFERYWDEYQYPYLPNGVAGYEHAKRAWNAAANAMRDKCVVHLQPEKP